MKNKGLKTLLYVLLSILLVLIIILLLLKFDILKNNVNTINNNNNNKNEIKNKTNKETKNSSTNEKIKNKIKEDKSGPAETEEEENINERVDNVTVNLELIGKEEITINVGDKYVDEGVKATDNNGNDVSDKITVENNVNPNKKGEYMIIYSYGKSIVIRTVIVK